MDDRSTEPVSEITPGSNALVKPRTRAHAEHGLARTPGRRSTDHWIARPMREPAAGRDLDALAIAAEQLRSLRLEAQHLTTSNQRLARHVAGASQAEAGAHVALGHDDLTGLGKALMFTRQLQRGITESSRRNCQLALLFIDLDGFKVLNERYGRNCGDQVLISVAARLMACIRSGDTAARYGGHEFVVLLADVENTASAIEIAEKIGRRIEEHYFIDGNEIRTSASIGLAMYPADGEDCDALLTHADRFLFPRDVAYPRRREYGLDAVPSADPRSTIDYPEAWTRHAASLPGGNGAADPAG